MNKTIFKYELRITDAQRINMPLGAEILTAQFQDGILYLWALVDAKATLKDRVIEIFGTGHPVWVDMGVQRRYIATAQEPGLVWHVFESV